MAALLAAVAVAMAAAPAVVTLTGSVTPSGPAKNGELKLDFAVNADSQSTFDKIKLTIPNGIKLSGRGFKTCSADFVNQNPNGEAGCPPAPRSGRAPRGPSCPTAAC